MTTRLAFFATATLALAAGCDSTYHARLGDGAGLGEGDPVVVSGVRVGQVEGVRVIEGQVDVELSIEDEHEVTLRTDACAMGMARDGQPTLVIVPGTGPALEEDRPIPQCELGGGQLGDIMRGLGEGLGQMIEQLGQGLFGGAGGAGGASGGGTGSGGASGGGASGGGTSGGGVPFPIPIPTSPPSPSSPSGTAPSVPPLPGATGAACGGMRVRVDGVEDVPPTPILLAQGGHRVWLVFENPSDRTMEVGPLSSATFSDASGRALHPARMPTEQQGWFMPFTVPANGSARRSVIFEGREEPALERLEARNTAPAGAPLETCVLTATGL